MVIAIEALVGMGLAQEGQGADALDDVILPAIGGRAVVDGQRGDARQMGRELFEVFGPMDCEVKAAGEEWGERGVGTDGEKAVGGKSEIRRPKTEGSPKAEGRSPKATDQ